MAQAKHNFCLKFEIRKNKGLKRFQNFAKIYSRLKTESI